jgi:OOP family OmpA-OmpF porin
MRQIFAASALTATLLAPLAAFAQSSPPSVDQIARALGRPAAGIADPLRVTPGMLKGPMRGIIPAAPAQLPSSVASTAAPAAAQPAPAIAASALNPCPPSSGTCALTIEFQTGSADLTPSAIATLENLGKALASLNDGGYRFRLEGHTDTVGTDSYNLSLSEQRAEVVRGYLSGHFPIDSARLQPVGMGKDHPLVQTPDQTPEARNRRVQVINMGA